MRTKLDREKALEDIHQLLLRIDLYRGRMFAETNADIARECLNATRRMYGDIAAIERELAYDVIAILDANESGIE